MALKWEVLTGERIIGASFQGCLQVLAFISDLLEDRVAKDPLVRTPSSAMWCFLPSPIPCVLAIVQVQFVTQRSIN